MATLPTAWLAPPGNLSSANHNTKISPAPIAISAAIGVLVCTLVTILFLRKNKDIFLEDRVPDAAETEPAPAIAEHVNHATSHLATHSQGRPQRPPPTHAKPMRRLPSFELQPKLDELLDFKNTNWDSEHGMQSPQLRPAHHQYYFSPTHGNGRSDVDTLQDDDEKNSTYVPYPRSEASDDAYGCGKGRTRRAGDLQVLSDDDDDDEVFRSSPSFASRTDLGDAY